MFSGPIVVIFMKFSGKFGASSWENLDTPLIWIYILFLNWGRLFGNWLEAKRAKAPREILS